MENKLESFEYSIKKWKGSLKGISLFESSKIACMISNPTDYVLDGYAFLNRDKIKSSRLIGDGLIRRILQSKAKDTLKNTPKIDVGIKDFHQLFGFLKGGDIFCELSLSKEDVVYIGRVVEVNEDSTDIDFYDTKFQLLDNAIVKYQDISVVTVFSDYSTTFEKVVKGIW